MRVLVIGCGSIGQRHIRNLHALGHEVVGVDPGLCGMGFLGQPVVLAPVLQRQEEINFRAIDAALICTPAHTHWDVARDLQSLEYVGPLFVEKPIATRADAPIFRDWPHPVTMVGYNWLFNTEVQTLRRLIGSEFSALLGCATDMAAWPGQSYGDPLLECSHEVATALHWLGDTARVTSATVTPTSAALRLANASGSVCVRVDWNEPCAGRRFSIGPASRIDPTWRLSPSPEALVKSYLAELQHFLTCIERNEPTMVPFSFGLKVVEICEQMKAMGDV